MLCACVEEATHQWLIGPRRIGKTSVAKAALARFRAAGAVALDVDMSKLAIRDEPTLAGELARQAQAADVGVSSTANRIKRFAGKRAADTGRLGRAMTSLGYGDEGEALSEGEVKIEGEEILAIIEASEGHPRRTMLICARVHSSAVAAPGREATTALVSLAIRDAKGDRSWT